MDKLFPDLAAVFAVCLLIFLIFRAFRVLIEKLFYKTAEENGIVFRYSKLFRRGFVKSVIWSGDKDAVYRLPEEFCGCKIIGLGDRSGFSVDLSAPDKDWIDRYTFRQSRVKSSELPEFEIKIEIGRFIREISEYTMLFRYVSDSSDDPKPLCRVKYTFSVDERNENFKTKRGKLFYWDGSAISETVPQ